jgi:glycosyltransferase involved in cell wall biosynthesis
MRILLFNWRDIRHSWAGGAEVYVDELAKRWAKDGNTVMLFCGNDGKNKRDEVIEGVRIIRRGGFYTVYLWAALYYLLKFRRNFDVIVDSENGIPFFSPLFSTKPIVLLIHHVHQEIFIEQMKFPFSYVGRFIEGKIMPFVYKNRTVVTVSESSKKEIVKVGISNESNIKIINPGIERPVKKYKKTLFPTITYLGRLKAYKNIDVAIKAFAITNKRFATARMWIVGEGDSLGNLQDLSIKLGLEKKVRFFGKVDQEQKERLLSQSWVSVQPSTVEGWGITVIEANASKTPVVASDTKGLRDSIIDGKTGILVKVKDVKGFAKSFNSLLKNSSELKRLSKNAYAWSTKFDWDASSENFYRILLSEVNEDNRAVVVKRAGFILNRFFSLF